MIETPQNLKLGIVTPDGTKKVKVKRKLPILVSCNNACQASVKIILITPLNTLKESTGGALKDNGFTRTGIKLTKRGLNYLKQKKNFRRSRYKIKMVAVDLETGQKVRKTKVFRFRK